MTAIYFTQSITLDEAKKLYRHLANTHHPDHGGDLRTMQEINAQYAGYLSKYAYNSERARQTEAHADGRKTTADYCDLNEVAEELRKIILETLKIQEIEVELCGLWIWVTGETKKHREEIKAVSPKYRYAPQKSAWYYPGVKSLPHREKWSLDKIRDTYGSSKFTRQDEEQQSFSPLPA